MSKKSSYKEFRWFFGFFVLFMSPLLIFGSPKFSDLLFISFAYLTPWVLVRISISKFGPGDTFQEALLKELMIFVLILFIFTTFILIIGSPSTYELIIAILAFSLIWLIRRYLVKRFF